MRIHSLHLTVLLAACSSGHPLDPGAGNSAGSGTATLLVDGTATARPSITNAASSTDFTTSFAIQLTLNNQPITTGTVTMTSNGGQVALVFMPNGQGNTGSWQGMAADYDEVYQLDVASGTDTITGVRVDGPDIHTFSAPTAGATVDSTMAMPLTWNRHDTADVATLRVGDGGGGGGNNAGLTITDSGTYMVAPGTLASNKQQAQTNTVRLTRSNHVVPAGAVAGSQLAVGVENDLDVVALPNPAALK